MSSIFCIFLSFSTSRFLLFHTVQLEKKCLVVVTLNLWDKVSLAMQTFSIVKDSVKANRL